MTWNAEVGLTTLVSVTTFPFKSLPLSSRTAASASSRDRYSINLDRPQISTCEDSSFGTNIPSSAILLVDITISHHPTGKATKVFELLRGEGI